MTAALPSRRRLVAWLAPAAFLAAAAGCGDDFDPKSLLNKYRVLGIRADPPDLVLDPAADPASLTVTLRAFDFDPASVDPAAGSPADPGAAAPVAPAYTWSYCTVSLGSAGGYKCLDGLEEHPIAGDGPEVVFDLAAERDHLQQDFAAVAALFGGAPDAGAGAPATAASPFELPTSIPLQIRLRSGDPAIGEVETVKTLTLRLPGDPEAATPNSNPRIRAFRIGGFAACPAGATEAGCFTAAPLGSPSLELEVELEPGASQTCNPSDLAAYICDPDSGREDLLYSWYTSAGEVEFSNTNEETLENRLKLPKSFPDGFSGRALPVRIFVAVRDGRGGIDVAEGSFSLTLPDDPSN